MSYSDTAGSGGEGSRKRARTTDEYPSAAAAAAAAGGAPPPGQELGFQQEAGDGEGGSDDDGVDKKTGRRKIKIEFITDKSRRHITFSKRKAGIMKKAYELSTLTGTQVLLLVVSETGLVYTFTTAKLQPLVTQPEGKNLIQACLNAPNGSLPGGASGPGMPPPPQAPRGRQAMNLGMPAATSPNNDAEGEEDGDGSGDSPGLGSGKGRRRRRTNSSSGAVSAGGMSKAIGSPSESMPSTSPTLSMQQPHGGGAAPYGSHPTHSPTLPHHQHHGQHHIGEPGMYAGYRGEGGGPGGPMMPYHHSQYGGLNAGGMPSGMAAGSVPGGAIGQAGSQPPPQQAQSQMWMQQGNIQRR